MPYAQGIIVVDFVKRSLKNKPFFGLSNTPCCILKGKAEVISERDMRQSMIKTSLGSLMYSSQDIYQAKSICRDLIIVHSGSEAYRKANQAKDYFLEFMSHQQRLYKKLASEERLFLQMLQLQPRLDSYLC